MNAPFDPALLDAAHADHAAAVARLCRALDDAFDASAHALDADEAIHSDPSRCAAFAQGVRFALAQALADAALVAPAQRLPAAGTDIDTYRRHLIAADPRGRYTVAALVWQLGHASPVHAHHTWCGYAVLDGTLTETLYDWNESRGVAEIRRAQQRTTGAITFGGPGRKNVHRLANDSAAQTVSLHVYGVAAARIATHVNDVLSFALAV
ncbi:putative metal-dependent enzyme (double-stranded beta helix superfamily) [Paraburkholderia tropica]|uniref:cysteine dioxygenase family protein n=1 Tax=Paraburkholderia tropica TaxID=92647 RepID=UPI001611BB2A|nr:cysteine dioxygenase family protein [Paraburkholderia tropica]MBB2999831.1 putative metal-dependent enzyme (double-stranded beta helix superfamily) [Paraburkholderia tropica]MBB6319462.1 putative metal-dependent enzyme (double-stranded beta helix superfamily) [Paraburkholderia tropica]